ncbi:MAG: histidine phosphatase family protein [Candidatus Paceibacterota bacterium]|jgi:broad specificity phosphatase PhoE
MKLNLKNRYFFLRHGQNNHQAEHQGIIYHWPDGNPPYYLTEQGKEEAKKAGETLKQDKIDCLFCSDILRCRETAKIVSEIIKYDKEKIVYDVRLRDLNWGAFAGKTKEEYWNFYNNDHMNAFEKVVPEGESWNQCRERMVKILNEIEEEFQDKTILIISHGDPLWLLEGHIKEIDDQTLLEKRKEIMLQPGEFKEIYE